MTDLKLEPGLQCFYFRWHAIFWYLVVWALEGVGPLCPLLALLIRTICLTWSSSFLVCWSRGNNVENCLWGLKVTRSCEPVRTGCGNLTRSGKASSRDYWSVFSCQFLGFALKRTVHCLRLIPEAPCLWVYTIIKYYYHFLVRLQGWKINELNWTAPLVLVPSVS